MIDLGDFAAELLLKGHDQLDQVQRVGVEIVAEAGFHRHGVLIDAQLIDDDGAHCLENCLLVCHGVSLPYNPLCVGWVLLF